MTKEDIQKLKEKIQAKIDATEFKISEVKSFNPGKKETSTQTLLWRQQGELKFLKEVQTLINELTQDNTNATI